MSQFFFENNIKTDERDMRVDVVTFMCIKMFNFSPTFATDNSWCFSTYLQTNDRVIYFVWGMVWKGKSENLKDQFILN